MVLAVRLDKQDQSHLAAFCRRKHLKKSQAAKELMRMGYAAALLEEFRHGRLSLGSLAEELGMTVLEAMDLLAEKGVKQEGGDFLFRNSLLGIQRLNADPAKSKKPLKKVPGRPPLPGDEL